MRRTRSREGELYAIVPVFAPFAASREIVGLNTRGVEYDFPAGSSYTRLPDFTLFSRSMLKLRS